MECEEVLEGSSSTIFRDGRNATVRKPFSGVAKRMRLACRTSFVPQCQPLREGLPCSPASLLCSSDWRCLPIYLLPHLTIGAKEAGTSQCWSLLYFRLLEQCLAQNKCSRNNVCLFFNERTKITFRKSLCLLQVSTNATQEYLFPLHSCQDWKLTLNKKEPNKKPKMKKQTNNNTTHNLLMLYGTTLLFSFFIISKIENFEVFNRFICIFS